MQVKLTNSDIMLPNKKHDKSHTDIVIHSFKIFDLIVTNDGFTGYGYTTEDFKKGSRYFL